MKMKKLVLVSLISSLSIISAKEVVGEGSFSLTPHFLASSVRVDQESQQVYLDVVAAEELDAGEHMPCEDHLTIPLTSARIDSESGKIFLSYNGKESELGQVRGRSGMWVDESDELKVHYDIDGKNGVKVSVEL